MKTCSVIYVVNIPFLGAYQDPWFSLLSWPLLIDSAFVQAVHSSSFLPTFAYTTSLLVAPRLSEASEQAVFDVKLHCLPYCPSAAAVEAHFQDMRSTPLTRRFELKTQLFNKYFTSISSLLSSSYFADANSCLTRFFDYHFSIMQKPMKAAEVIAGSTVVFTRARNVRDLGNKCSLFSCIN